MREGRHLGDPLVDDEVLEAWASRLTLRQVRALGDADSARYDEWIAAKLAPLRRDARRQVEAFFATPEGSARRDFLAVTLTRFGTAEERAQAADRVLDQQLGGGLHPLKREEVLRKLADDHGGDWQAARHALRDACRVALFEAVRAAEWVDVDRQLDVTRRALARLVPVYALGPQWRRERPDDLGDDQVEAAAAGPDRGAEVAAALTLIAAVGCTDREAEVFYATEVVGMNATEIGDRLGIKPSTVRVLLSKARSKLRKGVDPT